MTRLKVLSLIGGFLLLSLPTQAKLGVGYQDGFALRFSGQKWLALDLFPTFAYGRYRLPYRAALKFVPREEGTKFYFYGMKIGIAPSIKQWNRWRLRWRLNIGVTYLSARKDARNFNTGETGQFRWHRFDYVLETGPEFELRFATPNWLSIMMSPVARLTYSPDSPTGTRFYYPNQGPPYSVVHGTTTSRTFVLFDGNLLANLGVRVYF